METTLYKPGDCIAHLFLRLSGDHKFTAVCLRHVAVTVFDDRICFAPIIDDGGMGPLFEVSAQSDVHVTGFGGRAIVLIGFKSATKKSWADKFRRFMADLPTPGAARSGPARTE